MNKDVLDNLLKDYIGLQKKEEELKEAKDKMKSLILEELGGEVKYDGEFATATVANKETFKYTDEVAMINFMKANGYGTYVKEKIDTSFNKLLKEDVSVFEPIKNLYTKSLTEALTVKAK